MYDEMMDTIGLVGKADPELAAAMGRELTRQRWVRWPPCDRSMPMTVSPTSSSAK